MSAYDDAIEIILGVASSGFDLAFQHFIVAGIHVIVQRGGKLLDAERGEKAVIDAAAMAFVDDDEIEKVGRVVKEIGFRRSVRVGSGHEGLKDREENGAVFGNPAGFANLFRGDADAGVFGEGRELVKGLTGENVAVSEKQDARLPVWLTREIPAALKELPCDLKGDEGLAGAGRQRQQDALLPARDGFEYAVDGDVLIVARRPRAALVFQRHGGEAVTPAIFFGVGPAPEFVGSGEAFHVAFLARLHVDGVDAPAIGGTGEADGQLLRVGFGLAQAFGDVGVTFLGLNDGKALATIEEDIVGLLRLGTTPGTLQTAERDRKLRREATALDHAPARCAKGGVNQFQTCLGLVHHPSDQNPIKKSDRPIQP